MENSFYVRAVGAKWPTHLMEVESSQEPVVGSQQSCRKSVQLHKYFDAVVHHKSVAGTQTLARHCLAPSSICDLVRKEDLGMFVDGVRDGDGNVFLEQIGLGLGSGMGSDSQWFYKPGPWPDAESDGYSGS